MKVTIDPDSGFCFGVQQAIQTAEKELDKGHSVFALGELVHNQVQMDKLTAKGLVVISKDDLPLVKGKKVLFRAHGEPPETYQLAHQLDIEVIDATCPIVTRLQQRIRNMYETDSSKSVQYVIFGKPGHAEIAGLNGNADYRAIIVSDPGDLGKINFLQPVRLFSQTTMDAESYQLIGEAIREKMVEVGNTDLLISKSVCRQVSGRAPALRLFAAGHDAVVFVSGSNSSNGKYLFDICKSVNNNSYFISKTEDIKSEWFNGINTVGVSGATSTPLWLIEQVAGIISNVH